MNLEERLHNIERNTVEIVTQEELRNLLQRKSEPIAYIGFEASGPLHLGYVCVANKIIDLQEANFRVKILIADFHTKLNKKLGGDLERIRSMAEYFQNCFYALGVRREKAEFILGSSFQLSPRYFQDLLSLSTHVSIHQAKRAMDMASRSETDPEVSKVIYPLMQIADIDALDVDAVLAGIDQRKIHMLARNLLPILAKEKKRESYHLPVFIHFPLLSGLRSSKMSKSISNSYILVHDPPEVIQRRIMYAYCPPCDSAKKKSLLENNPILQICKYIIFRKLDAMVIDRRYSTPLYVDSYKELERFYENGNVHPEDLKKAVGLTLAKILDSTRRYLQSAQTLKHMPFLEVEKC